MYLVDTNVWLERLLDQSESDTVGRFLDATAGEHLSMTDFAERFQLDFDDAYQYAAAVKHELTIVSLGADFDRTERARITLAQALDST